MSLRQPILILGVVGTVAFLAIGATGVPPWAFAGPVASAVFVGWILNEIKEQFNTKKTAAKTPHKQEPIPEDGSDSGIVVDRAITIQPKSWWNCQVKLKKDDYVLVEVNADQPVSIALVTKSEQARLNDNKRYATERSRTSVRNANIEFETRRSGTWFVNIFNENRDPVEVGVRVSVEPPEQ